MFIFSPHDLLLDPGYQRLPTKLPLNIDNGVTLMCAPLLIKRLRLLCSCSRIVARCQTQAPRINKHHRTDKTNTHVVSLRRMISAYILAIYEGSGSIQLSHFTHRQNRHDADACNRKVRCVVCVAIFKHSRDDVPCVYVGNASCRFYS